MQKYAIEPLVTTEWLSQHLEDADLVVLDCTVHTEFNDDGSFHNRSGRTDYDRGHIPSAGFADLKGDLCTSDGTIEFAVPTPEQFCSAMGKLGVGDNTRVVLYDSGQSFWAARVWWMLRWVGFDRAALLDGGLQTWTAEGRPLSTEPVTRPTKHLSPAPRAGLIADKAEVLEAVHNGAVHNGKVSLIDTLPEASYRGEQTLYGRPGHIPGASSICAMNLLDESGRYRPLDELAAMHDGDRNARTITYCGGGIMASSSAFVLTRLGFTDVAVYTGSLQEWTTDPANPLVVDASEGQASRFEQ